MNKHQEKMLTAAVNYADRGWRVLPVAKQSKTPLILDWTHAASSDALQVVKWWQEHPTANIGILTGADSGFFVVDIDIKDGVNGLDSLIECFGERLTFDPKKYLTGMTATGGIHLLFQWQDDLPVKTCAAVLPGVDLRGVGGQIVVAPSPRNINGAWIEYRWNDETFPISPIEPWVEDLVKIAGKHHGDSNFDVAKVMEGIGKGDRDNQLFRYAWHLKQKGIDYGLAVGFVMEAAKRAIPPFDPAVAKEKVERAYRDEVSAETIKSEKIRLVKKLKELE